jgi:hypothetical protein
MSTVEVRTADLIGPALDWAVAQAEGFQVEIRQRQDAAYPCPLIVEGQATRGIPRYCSDWGHTGPLVEKYNVSLIYAFEEYQALIGMTESEQHEKPLVAICRAIVSAKLGDAVQVPEELLP